MQARWTAYLGQVQTRAVSSIVVIPVHVQDLLALDRQETRQDAFRQPSAQNNNLPAIMFSFELGNGIGTDFTSYSSSMVASGVRTGG